ncbi:MAG: FTR1 family protein [Alphaproteobacteria bacterium]|nr:FTR1 family protein [Alphaproteobacteria bacterium]MBL6936197.1 FTR1 family protein [Alphaproteobacteria bacterium]MBL7098752.1 FTR1 family protein [Alphaproteobacteria bacterium]
MLSSLIIVFREVIEAGLIVGIVLAATKGVLGRGLWVTLGVMAGVAGACLVALFAGEISNLFEGSGQELFNATILLLAVMMLTWHNVWMASHGREIAREMKAMGAAVSAGQKTLTALAIVVAVAVLREGSEVVLFLYGIAAQGGQTTASLLLGGVLGLAGGAAMSALMYFGLLSIPAHRLFSVTGWLITLLAAGMAAQAVLFIQSAGYLQVLMSPLWDTSWLLPEGGEGVAGIIGRMLHTLIGYSDQPNGMQLIAYLGTIVTINVLMRVVNQPRPIPAAAPNAAE